MYRPVRLQQFFERTAVERPSATAVLDEDRALTYRDLDQRANQLAHHLRRAGIGPGRRVGILLNRSWRTYAALLGALKAGATFVPIDPASPRDRVEYIAGDAGLDVLLTTSDLLPATADVSCRVVPLDVEQSQVDAAPVSTPPLDLAGDPPCYVIYTSGSSGRPKGVAVAHSSICNFIDVVPRVYDVRPSDRVYQGMTISFDFSIEEIWPTCRDGATLVVGPSDSRRLGAELADFLDEKRVTSSTACPTLLATIPRDLPTVRSSRRRRGVPGRPGGTLEPPGAADAQHLRADRGHGHRDLGRAAAREARDHRTAAADVLRRPARRAAATRAPTARSARSASAGRGSRSGTSGCRR